MNPARISVFAALALCACQQPATTEPGAKPGSALSNGRLVLPAVKGNPGAAYFTYSNRGDATVALATVAVGGAESAFMHTTKDGAMIALVNPAVGPGETVEFAPRGKHVMVFEIAPSVAPGGETELTLTFANGDRLSAPLKVVAAGGMDMAH